MKKQFILDYDKEKWEEKITQPVNTLQLFITNRCNLRCRGCFYKHKLGSKEISLEEYKKYIDEYKDKVQKIILLGGEPTLHKNLKEMIDYNNSLNLKTTVYTNGVNLNALEKANLSKTTVRIGVYGSTKSEKPLFTIKKTPLKVMIVYMLRKDNIDQLEETAKMAEKFNCEDFYISSIRDIHETKSYWIDTPETIPFEEYFKIIQSFVNNYTGKIKRIHISRRAVIKTKNQEKYPLQEKCRFGNLFPTGEKIICPFDISLSKTSDKLIFNERMCNKNTGCGCILQKIVLERKKQTL
jgi:MoaA/NifB/PqqE/SkfB family radical SAM enzyme